MKTQRVAALIAVSAFVPMSETKAHHANLNISQCPAIVSTAAGTALIDVAPVNGNQKQINDSRQLLLDECNNTSYLSSWDESCFLGIFRRRCMVTSRKGSNRKSRYIPKYLFSGYGSLVAKGNVLPVNVLYAQVTRKDNNEMNVRVTVNFPTLSRYKTPSLKRRTTALMAPSQDMSRNLARQCEHPLAPAGYRDGYTGLKGFFQHQGQWRRAFQFDTDRSKCDYSSSDTSVRDRNTGRYVAARSTVNTGTFLGYASQDSPGPHMAVLSNGYIAAFIRCNLQTQSCETRYPSIFSETTSDHASWKIKDDFYLGTASTSHLSLFDLEWSKASTLPIWKQMLTYLTGSCLSASNKLREVTRENITESRNQSLMGLTEDCMAAVNSGPSFWSQPTISSIMFPTSASLTSGHTLCRITPPRGFGYGGSVYESFVSKIDSSWTRLGKVRVYGGYNGPCSGLY